MTDSVGVSVCGYLCFCVYTLPMNALACGSVYGTCYEIMKPKLIGSLILLQLLKMGDVG
jgi:hypothetical protein